MSIPEDEQPPQLNEPNDAGQISLDSDAVVDVDKVVASPCPLRIYTRPQILRLHSSPLVGPPLGMPELKEWFGAENEQNLNKRDAEPSTPNNARERRFRRDVEDADSPSRSTFRSSLNQPTQMGNFKHQSFRGNDRDGDKDKERDIRDKEGQERLRNLSEKYDRDRLAGNRTKDREPAPHLAAGSSRIPGPQLSAVPGRRSEVGRKKNGEGEDWRRATDNRRSGREERSDRARSRSRARDSSRPRRDRDKEDKKEKEKERDHRKGDKEDDPRRDREKEKDAEDEDPRRWRDDGKRDERMATRRERERTARDKDAPKDGSDRWTIDDRDSRPKRNSGKDKKSTTASEEVWDRDRTDKEKEPAWMDADIPPPSGAGILGGKGPDGELDGIQVWKRGIKEKEQKEKDSLKENSDNNLESSDRLDSSAEPLDEIQQFKLMMKREQERQPSPNVTSSLDPSAGQTPEALTNAKPNGSPDPTSESGLLAKSTTQSLLSILTSGDPSSSSSNKNISPSSDSTGRAATSRLFPNPISHDGTLTTENAPPQSSRFTPPQGSRLLALGNRSSAKAILPTNVSTFSQQTNGSPSTPRTYADPTMPDPPRPDALGVAKDSQRPPSGLLPFEEQPRPYVLDEQRTIMTNTARRIERPDSAGRTDMMPPDPAGYAPSKGSRFAKFFDGKAKDSSVPKPQIGATASPTIENQRHDVGPADRTVDDLFIMLNNSVQRTGQVPPVSHSFGQQSQSQVPLPQAVPPPSQSQPHHRLEPLYESRMDNRNFVPDGMVPGLRPAPPRNRDNGGMFGEHIDDSLSYNVQRVVPMAQRGPELTYSGLGAGVYPHAVRNGQLQAHYRGGPSPIPNPQPSLQNTHLQRLPPGLANLGGRPPHEPSHFANMHGISSSPLHGSLHGGMMQAQPPPQFNNIGFGGQTHVRMSPGQLQNSSSVQQNLGPSNLDIRTSTQAQLLGLGGARGGFPQGPNTMQNPLLAMRQQQQLVMPHMLPQQLQQPPSNNNTHDLMALLMGGHQRE